jgi:antitoxin component of MazEF toxin-antitoxin module
MRQKIVKIGRNSLAVIIPARFVHGLNLKSGDYVQVKTDLVKGNINLRFSGTAQMLLPDAK